jgi:hypothetical protein
VQDADESITEGAQGLMVEVSGSAVLVVERSRAGTGVDGAEGPLVDGGVEPSIADTAGQDGALLTRGDGQW